MKHTLLILPLLALLLSGCNTSYSVQKATSQTWMGGAAGSGGGINYKVFVEKKGNGTVTIDKVWLGSREKGWNTQYSVFPDSSRHMLADHQVDAETSLFRVEFAELTPAPPNPRGDFLGPRVPPFDAPPTDLPAEFQQGAVIYYTSGKGTTGQWVVEEFEKLEPIAYP